MQAAGSVGEDRIYGLDLYKILGMLLVVAFHFSFHGNVIVNCAQELSFNWIVLAVARIFGAVCNCAFMLISGYFLYRKNFNVRTVFRLWLQVWFYSVVFGTVCVISGTEQLTAGSLIKMVFPFTSNQYWFFSTYIVIYLIFPFLNKCIDGLSRKQHQAAIVLGLILVPLFATFAGERWTIGTNSIEIFIVLYFVGAYFNKYDVCVSAGKSAVMAASGMILEILSLFGMRIVYRLTGINDVTYFVWDQNKIFPVLTGIALFLLFKQIRVRHIRMIPFLSSSVFGVYLLHDGWAKGFLFGRLFDDSATYDTNLLLPQMILAVCTIFAAGILIDKVRIRIFERPVLKMLNPVFNKINAVCADVWGDRA